MAELSAVERARALLVQRRLELLAELRQVNEALEALEPITRPEAPAPNASRAPGGGRPSVRTMLLSLLDEDDRDWSAGEVLEEYARRGTPVHGADPNNALRAAIADANKAGQIVRTSMGRYKSAKWKSTRTVKDAFFGGGLMTETEVATG